MKESLPWKFLFVRGATFDGALQVVICNDAFYLFLEVEALFGGILIGWLKRQERSVRDVFRVLR